MRKLVLLALFSTIAQAQYSLGANALQWSGATSTAGVFCWGFSCTPAQASAQAGETGTLMVRAEFGQPYAIGVSLSATRCLALPNFQNALVIDDPILIWRTGICATGSPILSCPGGTDSFTITIPPSFPSGTTFAIQAVTGVPGGPGFPAFSFTQAIAFTIL
jgi:hypothetical protein